MALAATTVWECQTGGSDTLNGGAFDPGQTAGMFTDGTATSPATASPVFSSASYNFVAGDVGAWVYISSGTSSGGVVNSGWYKIASVAANAATLNATIGQGVLKSSFIPSTLTGVVTGTTLTAATWSIDYSQQAAAQFSYTDLASVGAGLLVSSVAKPFAKQQVGNSLIITGGTNFTPGTYVIASVAAGVATVVGPGNITTGAGVSGTGGQGGAILSPAIPFGLKTSNNQVFVKAGTYSITTASTNVAGGCISDVGASSTVGNRMIEGYNSIRGDLGTAPLLQISGSLTTPIIINVGGTNVEQMIRNLVLDGISNASSRGIVSSRRLFIYKVGFKNFTANGCETNTGASSISYCYATGCGGTTGTHYGFIDTNGGGHYFACEAYSNTVGGFFANSTGGSTSNCLAYGNSGGSSDGFISGTQEQFYQGCVAYNNGRDGFRIGNGFTVNCIAEANVGKGFNRSSVAQVSGMIINCATYNNTGGAIDTVSFPFVSGLVAGSGSFFTNAAGGDFSLNNTAGAGAAARAAGYPGVYPSGTTTGFIDIGAAQHADPASGGGGMRLAGRGGLASGA